MKTTALLISTLALSVSVPAWAQPVEEPTRAPAVDSATLPSASGARNSVSVYYGATLESRSDGRAGMTVNGARESESSRLTLASRPRLVVAADRFLHPVFAVGGVATLQPDLIASAGGDTERLGSVFELHLSARGRLRFTDRLSANLTAAAGPAIYLPDEDQRVEVFYRAPGEEHIKTRSLTPKSGWSGRVSAGLGVDLMQTPTFGVGLRADVAYTFYKYVLADEDFGDVGPMSDVAFDASMRGSHVSFVAGVEARF